MKKFEKCGPNCDHSQAEHEAYDEGYYHGSMCSGERSLETVAWVGIGMFLFGCIVGAFLRDMTCVG